MTSEERLTAFARWIETSRSKRTAKLYSTNAKEFEDLILSRGWTLETAPKNAVSEYARMLYTRNLKPQSAAAMVAGVNSYLRFLGEQLGLETHFARAVMQRLTSTRRDALLGDDLKRVLHAARDLGEPYATMIQLLPATGLRLTEMCLIRDTDVIVERNEDGTRDVLFAVMGKGLKPRKVPLLREALPIFFSYIRHARPRLPQSEWVFPAPYKGPVKQRTVQGKMDQLKRVTGCRKATPHALRHTYITMLIQRGVDPFAVMALVGHGKIDVTMRYVHHDMEHLKNSVNKIKAPWLESK